MEDRFSRFHPAITFIFYIGAVVCAMVFYHPAYLIAAAAGSAAFLLTVRGRRAFKLMAGLAVIFVVIMAVNPFSCEAFISRKGRIPAPIHSFKN